MAVPILYGMDQCCETQFPGPSKPDSEYVCAVSAECSCSAHGTSMLCTQNAYVLFAERTCSVRASVYYLLPTLESRIRNT